MGNINRTDDNPANRDPITGAPGSHPVGAVGAVAGGLAGHAAAEAFNPSVHEIYWREAYTSEPYYKSDYTYDDYAPGYRTGYETAGRYMGQNKRFDDLEPELRAQYERIKGKSRLAWEDAKQAARAAWDRVERVMPGDFDNDGR
jgi:hypothetical protein